MHNVLHRTSHIEEYNIFLCKSLLYSNLCINFVVPSLFLTMSRLVGCIKKTKLQLRSPMLWRSGSLRCEKDFCLSRGDSCTDIPQTWSRYRNTHSHRGCVIEFSLLSPSSETKTTCKTMLELHICGETY